MTMISSACVKSVAEETGGVCPCEFSAAVSPPIDRAGAVDDHDVANRHQHAGQQQHALQHIDPDHRLDAADRRIDRGDEADDADPPVQIVPRAAMRGRPP